VTAGLFVRRREQRHGRAPWPGPHRGPAGRAGGPPASVACAGPSVGGYGSAALCLISSAGHPIPWGPVAGSPALVAWLFGKRYGFPPAQGVTRRCLPGGISRRGDPSPEGVTWPAGVWCQGSGPAAGPTRRPRSGWPGGSCALIGPGEPLRRVTAVRAERPPRSAAVSSGRTRRHAVGRGKRGHAVLIGRVQA